MLKCFFSFPGVHRKERFREGKDKEIKKGSGANVIYTYEEGLPKLLENVGIILVLND
jgi:hypothetical protein